MRAKKQGMERESGKGNSRKEKNGKWKEFNKDAVLVAEGNYLYDLKQGVWREYYETGELLIEEVYNQGILHGRYAAYHLNGKVMSEGQYVSGNREGYFHIYDEDGRNVESMFFVKNLLIETIAAEAVPFGQLAHQNR
jgi:antitoxin component YwqK of YwqJK toxin-antitoxin module